jgi:hypothetical protein
MSVIGACYRTFTPELDGDRSITASPLRRSVKPAACRRADCRLVERAAGIAADAARRFDVAQRHFETALRQAATLPHRPEEAHTRRWYARMLLDRDGPGDRQRATSWPGPPLPTTSGWGCPRRRELAAAFLASDKP